jgi:hypothetical protein
MADVKVEEKKVEGQQFDTDALATQLGGMFRESLHEFANEQQQEARRQQETQQQAQRQASYNDRQAGDPLAQAIQPYVAPGINAAILEAQSATDAAKFYSSTDLDRKHWPAIEQAFERMKAQGTPLKREELDHWYRGKNAKMFQEEAIALAQAKEQEALKAQGGVGGLRVEPSATPKALTDPYGATHEELTTALKNVSF